jgi:Glycerophosphoryl diester phosphodiesterase
MSLNIRALRQKYFRDDGIPLVIAHRGASADAPENTLPAFLLAVQARADICELDVHLSKDGVLVVIHDATVDRTTNGTGKVRDFTVAELRALDAGYRFTVDSGKTNPYRGSGVTIPTLEEVLVAHPNQKFLIELKDSRELAAIKLHDQISKLNAFDRVIVQLIGVKHKIGRKVRKIDGRLVTGHTSKEIATFLLLSRLRLTRLFKTRGITFEVPQKKYRYKVVTPLFVRQAHKAGIAVVVWTVNSPADMKRLCDMQVDGLVTDSPRTARQLLDKR